MHCEIEKDCEVMNISIEATKTKQRPPHSQVSVGANYYVQCIRTKGLTVYTRNQQINLYIHNFSLRKLLNYGVP